MVGCLVVAGPGVAAASEPVSPGVSTDRGTGTPSRIPCSFGPSQAAGRMITMHVFTMAPDGADAIEVTPFDPHRDIWSHRSHGRPTADHRTRPRRRRRLDHHAGAPVTDQAGVGWRPWH